MKLPDKILLGLLFIVAFVFGIKLIHEPDLWWMLRTGEWITQNGVPKTDPFSFTYFGADWLNVKWLFEVLVYGISKVFGVGWITFLQAIYNVLMVYFLFRISQLFKILFSAFALVVLVALFGLEFRMLNRPEMTSHLLSIVNIFIWLRHRQKNDKWLFALIPLQAFWANMHEAYAIGVVVSSVFVLGSFIDANAKRFSEKFKLIKKEFLVVVASGFAVVLHPSGLKMLFQPFEIFSQLGSNKFTTELYGIATNYYWAQKEVYITFGLIAIVLVGVALTKFNFKSIKQQFGLGYLLLILLFAYLATTAHRNIPFVVLAVIPVTAYYLNELINKLKLQKVLPWASIAAGLVVYGLVTSNWYYRKTDSANDFGIGVSTWNNPVQLAEFLQQSNLQGNGFSDYLVSSYLMWNGKENFKTYIDFRDLDVFPAKFFQDFLRMTDFPVLFIEEDKKRDFDYVVLYRPMFNNLHKYLYHSPDWKMVYADIIGCVYVKTSKYPDLQATDFEPQEILINQTAFQATLASAFWPFGKTPPKAFNDNLEATRFFTQISAYNKAAQFAEMAKTDQNFKAAAMAAEGDIYLTMADDANTAEEQIRILDKAIGYYQNTLSVFPENEAALFGFGYSLYKKGDFGNAQSILLKLIKQNPEYFQAYQILAELQNVFMRTDQKNAAGYAKKWFEYMLKAHDIEPEDQLTNYKLGVSYCQRNQCGEANKFLEKLPNILPQLTDPENDALRQCKGKCG